MTTWHVDLAQTYEPTWTHDGASQAFPWGGGAGIVRAVAAAAAGDTILLANAADPQSNQPLGDVFWIDVVDAAGMAAGEIVTINPGGSFESSGRIIACGGHELFCSPLTGMWSCPDGTAVSTPSASTSTNGYPQRRGVSISSGVAADGAGGGSITIEGVAADWVTPADAYLDAAAVEAAVDIGEVSGWTLRRLHIDRPGVCGVSKTSTVAVTGWVLDRVRVTNAGDRGFRNMTYLQYGKLRQCRAVGATNYGFQGTPSYGRVDHCAAIGNGLHGVFYTGAASMLEGCLIANNGASGLRSVSQATTLVGCVIDGNGGDGVDVATTESHSVAIMHNRFTNNGGYGIYAGHLIGPGWVVDGNVFYGNTDGPSDGVVHGDNDHGAAASGLPHEDVSADGYVDRGGGDYSLTTEAVARREGVNVTDLATDNVSAGFAPSDSRRDIQVSFPEIEVTFS